MNLNGNFATHNKAIVTKDQFPEAYNTDGHLVVEVRAAVAGSQICINNLPTVAGDVAQIGAVEVAQLDPASVLLIQRTTGGCTCAQYGTQGCNTFDYEPLGGVCLNDVPSQYVLGGANDLFLGDLLFTHGNYNDDITVTITTKIGCGSCPA